MSVVKKIISLEHIPAVIWGVPSSKVYLYVHGQGGNKEEAADFAEIVCRYGFQTLSIDLPANSGLLRPVLRSKTAAMRS